MQIKIHTQNLSIGKKKKEIIYHKVEKLTRLSNRLDDESCEIKVELSHEESRSPNEAYICNITIFAPSKTLNAKTRSDSIINATDLVIAKLKKQIEHYKAKIHRMGERGK